MTLEEMKVIIKAETKQYRDELAKMKAQTASATAEVERQTSKIKSCFSGIGKAMAGFGIGYALFKIGKQAIGFASDLQEVQNVVDVAFGSMSYKCEQFAKNSIKQFGMSELSAKQYSSTFMAMGKGMGIGLEDGSNMAIELTKRVGDASSYFNKSQEEIATKLKGVYTGETEALKDIGVVMTQSNLKQYAMKNGMDSNIESMDQGSLTMLRYKFVMDSLNDTQGDFVRTGGSWANQVRILKEQWGQLLGIIGNGLVAIFTPVIRAINAAISKVIQFAQIVQTVFSSLFGKKGNSPGDEAKKIGANLGGAESNASGLNDQLDKTASKAKKAAGQLASIDEINNMSSSSSGDDGVGGSIGGIGAIDYGANEEGDTSGIDKTIAKVKEKLESFKKMVDKYKAPITASLAGLGAGLATFMVIKNWPALIGPIKNLFINMSALFGLVKDVGFIETFSSLFMGISAPMLAVVAIVASVTAALVYLYQTSSSFRTLVNDTVSGFIGLLQNFYKSILEPLFSLLADVFKTILVPLATFIATVFVKAVEVIASVVLSFWKNVTLPLANFLVDILGIALQSVIEIWKAWKPVIELIFVAISWIWDSILSPIADWIKDVFIKIFEQWGAVIKDLIPSVKKVFQGLVDFLVGIFTLDVDKCLKGVEKMLQGLGDFLTNIFKKDWTSCFGAIGGVLNGFLYTVSTVWDSIKQVFNGVITFISGVFTGDWGRVWQGALDVFAGIFGGLSALVKAPINAVIGLVNSAIDGINSISVDIPKWVPKWAGGGKHFGFNLGKIAYLARGGVVDRPTPAIFGEAGAEAVVPLENNTGWMAKVAAGISDYMGFGFNEDLNDLLILMQELIDIVREKNYTTIVELNERMLNKSNQKEERLNKLRTGTV